MKSLQVEEKLKAPHSIMAAAATIIGIEVGSGIFYTILYMTIAMIINILVCILAARDTYKRVKHTNDQSKKHRWTIAPPRQKSTGIDAVNRLMSQHANSVRSVSESPTLLHETTNQHDNQSSVVRVANASPTPDAFTPHSQTESMGDFPDTSRAEHAMAAAAPKNPFLPSPDALLRTEHDNLPKLNTYGIGMGRRWQIYSPIILHIWDTGTDIGVIWDWLTFDNASSASAFLNIFSTDVSSYSYAGLAISAILIYRIVSGIAIFRTLGWKPGLAQFLDVLIYREVYEAYVDSKIRPTIHFRWIRRMEAIFESFLQSLVQIAWVLATRGDISYLMASSILVSVYSISSSIIRDDDWKFGSKKSLYRKKCPPSSKYLLRATFRLSEILARLCCFTIFWSETLGILLSMWFAYQFIFYIILFHFGKLGKNFGNAFSIILAYPNLSYRDHDYLQLGKVLHILGIFTLWTPFAYMFKKWNNVSLFYLSRFTENTIILFGCLLYNYSDFILSGNIVDLYFELSFFVFIAYTVGIFFTFYNAIVYFVKIRKYLNDIEIGLNLDIWGVLIQAVEDIDILRRFVKRAPNTIHQTKDDGTTTFMEAARLAELNVFLCLVHGDVYQHSLEDEVSAVELYQHNIDQKRALMSKFRGNSRLQIHNYKWKTPNGYVRNDEGKSVIYYLMQQYVKDCEKINEEDAAMKMNKSTFKFQSVHLWKHDKLFKQRKKWLLVFLKHISRNPPSSKQRANERDLIEYKRTAFQLGFMEPEEWKQWIYKIKHSQQKSGFFGKRNKSEKGTLHDLDEIMDEMEQKELRTTTTMGKHEQINSISMAQDDVEIVAIKKHASEISATSSMNFSLSFSESENEKIFINMADNEGETALHWATELNCTVFLNLLLEFGANPNIVCKDKEKRFKGETAMVMAVRLDRYEILDAFVVWNNENNNDVQCDWYIPDNQGNDVIFACIAHDRPELLNDLLLAGIDVTHVNPDCNTILQFALLSKKKEFVDMILEKNMISDNVQNLLNKNNQDNSVLEMAVLPRNKQYLETILVHFMEKMTDDRVEKGTLDKRLLWTEIIFCFKKCIDLMNADGLKIFFQKAKSVILSGNEPECHKIIQKIIMRGNKQLLEICCCYFSECLKLKNANDETILFYCIRFNRPTPLRLLVNKYKCSLKVKNKDGLDLIKYCDRFDRMNCKQFIQRHVDRAHALQRFYADDVFKE